MTAPGSPRPASPQPATATPVASTGRDVALVVGFSGFTVALALVPALPSGPVPVTLQPLAVMLCGLLLGPARGAAAVAGYVLLGLVGLPVFAGQVGGLGVLSGAMGGFVLGLVPGALVTGLLTVAALRRERGRLPLLLLAAVAGGIGVVYLVGVPWFVAATPLSAAQTLSTFAPLVAWDLLRALLAALVAATVHRAFPNLLARR